MFGNIWVNVFLSIWKSDFWKSILIVFVLINFQPITFPQSSLFNDLKRREEEPIATITVNMQMWVFT